MLSSTGAGCEHAAHFATQLPYALVAWALSIARGTIPAGLGLPAWVCFLMGTLGCVVVVRFVGKLPEHHEPSATRTTASR